MTDKPTNILDLDSFITQKVIKLKGKERALRSMTVGDFINAKTFDEKMAAANGDTAGQIDMLVDRILEYLGDTTKDELLALDQSQLFAIFAFVRGDEAAAAAGVSAAKK